MVQNENNFIQISRQVEELRKEIVLLRKKETRFLKIEEELRTIEARFGKIIYDIPFPAEIYDSRGYTILINRAFLELCRIPSDELILNKYNIFDDPLIEELKISSEIHGAFSGELVVIPEINIQFEKFRKKFGVQKEGNEVFELTMFPLFNSGGFIDQVVAIWKNITPDIRIESRLNLIISTMDSAEYGVFITDSKARIIWTNKAFTLLTGYNKSEIIGKNPDFLKSGEQDEQFYENLWGNISRGKIWRGKLINRRKDGSLFTELEMITPIKNNKGEIEHYIATVHDITDQKKTEDELKRLNRSLKTISACNSVMIHSINENELLSNICKIIVDLGQYNFSWIGLLSQSPELSLTPAASYGISDKKLKLMMPYLNYADNHANPIFQAIELKKFQVVKYSMNESENFNRNKIFAENNYQSMVTFPLFESGDVFGILCIYSNNIEAFSDDEIKMLDELSEDLSYGIKALRIKSERENARKLLGESEEKYRHFFEEDLAGDYISDINGRILDCNESFVKIFGFSSIDEAKKYNIGILHPSVESRELLIERVKKEKIFKGLELELKTIDNRKKYIIENVWGSFNEKGELIEIKGYIFDITERKLTELALLDSELRFRELVENINEIIYSTDINGIVTYISPSIRVFGGYKPEDVTGKDIIEFLLPADSNGLKEYFKSIVKDNLKTFEFRMLSKTGEIRWVKTSARLIISANKVVGIRGVITDISELKEVVSDLKKAKEESEKSEKLKTEFLAQMSHEIRTPVNVILSYNSLLREEFNDKVSEEYSGVFKSIEQASNRLVRTIDLILNMSMFKAGKIEVAASNVDLYFILLNLIQEFKNKADEKKLKLTFCNNASNVYLRTDEFILIHVFQNLIENAIKYTYQGRVEVILYNNSEHSLCVDVKDTGIGISKDYLESMFKPFTQEDTGYSRKYEGVGLGLALVKNYLDLIGALIKVDSEKGKGSVFTVIFKQEQ
ncbi:MAG: PAS domain S-box protein [Ignavibacteriaceae bacterium]